MSTAGFIAVELLFLAAAHVYGGPPWVAIGVLAFLGQAAAGTRIASLATLVPALAWLALARVTGDRELFFPYCMHLASHVAVALAPRSLRVAAAGGGLLVAAFLAIRVLQRAGPRVLAVETVVALAILAMVLVAAAQVRRRAAAGGGLQGAANAAIVVAASLLAYAGLAL